MEKIGALKASQLPSTLNELLMKYKQFELAFLALKMGIASNITPDSKTIFLISKRVKKSLEAERVFKLIYMFENILFSKIPEDHFVQIINKETSILSKSEKKEAEVTQLQKNISLNEKAILRFDKALNKHEGLKLENKFPSNSLKKDRRNLDLLTKYTFDLESSEIVLKEFDKYNIPYSNTLFETLITYSNFDKTFDFFEILLTKTKLNPQSVFQLILSKKNFEFIQISKLVNLMQNFRGGVDLGIINKMINTFKTYSELLELNKLKVSSGFILTNENGLDLLKKVPSFEEAKNCLTFIKENTTRLYSKTIDALFDHASTITQAKEVLQIREDEGFPLTKGLLLKPLNFAKLLKKAFGFSIKCYYLNLPIHPKRLVLNS